MTENPSSRDIGAHRAIYRGRINALAKETFDVDEYDLLTAFQKQKVDDQFKKIDYPKGKVVTKENYDNESEIINIIKQRPPKKKPGSYPPPKKPIKRIVIQNNIPYAEIQYKSESDLEKLAFESRYSLFGEDIVYFDTKRKITSAANISKIPDALFLSITSYDEAKLWIVEYELSSHDIDRHITPQILGFMKAMQNETTKKNIREMMYKEIRKDTKIENKIKSIMPPNEEIHYFLETVLDRDLGIVIVIDKKTPKLEEVADLISGMIGIRSQILEFITFENNKGKKIHVLEKHF